MSSKSQDRAMNAIRQGKKGHAIESNDSKEHRQTIATPKHNVPGAVNPETRPAPSVANKRKGHVQVKASPIASDKRPKPGRDVTRIPPDRAIAILLAHTKEKLKEVVRLEKLGRHDAAATVCCIIANDRARIQVHLDRIKEAESKPLPVDNPKLYKARSKAKVKTYPRWSEQPKGYVSSGPFRKGSK